MANRITDLTLAVLASAVSFLLSWPFWRDFEYWPESRYMWLVYFIIGFVLAIYVFYAFMGSLQTLFAHDADEHAALSETNNTVSSVSTNKGQP
jgi:hypothetical protein